MPQTLFMAAVGVAALHKKAQFSGILSGAATGCTSEALLASLTDDLLVALTPGTEPKALQDKCACQT